MNIKNTTKKILLSLTILLLSTVVTHAGFGVSPTNIDSRYLKPGATFTQEFVLSRSDPVEDMDIVIIPDLGDMESWFKFDPGLEFIFKRGETTKTFKAIVTVPEDAQFTNYNGVIRINAMPSTQAVGGVSITQGVRLDAGLTVTDQDYTSLAILSITPLEAELGKPVRIEIIAQNNGNVSASPTAKITVMDLLMNVLEEHEITNIGSVGPNLTETLIAQFTSKLPEGEYFVNVQVYLGGELLREERLVINIVPGPVEEPEEEEETTFNISSLFTGFRENLPYILISILTVFLVDLLLEKIWRKKTKTLRAKTWAILLGSKKIPRIVVSTIVGLVALLTPILYPVKGALSLPKISLKEYFNDFVISLPYILFAVIVFVASYLILEKIWRKKKSKTLKAKWWALLLGSKKYYRILPSFVLSLIGLLLSTFVPLVLTNPTVSTPDTTLIQEKISYIFSHFTDYIPYLVFALMTVVVSYLLLEKLWKKTTMKKRKAQWWAVLLGCEKYSRMLLSIVLGVAVFVLAISFTLVTFKSVPTKDTDIDTQGETQGVSTSTTGDSYLNVTNGYVIYERQDTSSEIVYIAEEGEQFDVITQTEEWYQVKLSNGSSGWLEKNIVGETVTEER